MTITASSAQTVRGTDTDARDYATDLWTPVPGRTYLLGFSMLDLGSARDLGNATADGNGITWAFEKSVAGAANEPGLAVWKGVADSSCFMGATTISGVVTSGNTADGAIWGIVEFTGTLLGDFVVQSVAASTAADSITATLAAFASASNATFAWILSYDNASTTGPTITQGTGFTLGSSNPQAMGGDGLRLAWQFRSDNDTSVDATAAAANDRMLMIAFEISIPTDQAVTLAAAGVTVTPGTLVIPANQAITPAAAAVSVSAGTLSVAQSLALTAKTVTVTPGSISIARTLILTNAAVTVAPGTVSVHKGVGLSGVSIHVTPGTLTVALQNQPVSLIAAAVSVSAGSLYVARYAVPGVPPAPAPATKYWSPRGGGRPTLAELLLDRQFDGTGIGGALRTTLKDRR